MPFNSTRKPILIHSFETAARSTSPNREAMIVPAAANGDEGTDTSDSIFRTTEK